MPEESRKAHARLDPRMPLVINTHELSRRPGSMRTLTRTVPAPADLSLEVIGVPEGSDLELDLRLESVLEGVLVSGTAGAPITGECARCLEPVSSRVEVDLQELFFYPGVDADDDAERLEGDFLDLEPTLRDAVVFALPFAPVCREDCPGLCPECGVRLAEVPADHQHDVVDPRWAALQDLDQRTTEIQES